MANKDGRMSGNKGEWSELYAFMKLLSQGRVYAANEKVEKIDEVYITPAREILFEEEQRDNIINKTGLSLPFMVDLSVKLRDYDLISNINLDKNRMINEIWK